MPHAHLRLQPPGSHRQRVTRQEKGSPPHPSSAVSYAAYVCKLNTKRLRVELVIAHLQYCRKHRKNPLTLWLIIGDQLNMLAWFLLSGLTQKTCIPTPPTMKMNMDICRRWGTNVYAGWRNSLSLATLQGTYSLCIQHVLMLKLYGKVQLH